MGEKGGGDAGEEEEGNFDSIEMEGGKKDWRDRWRVMERRHMLFAGALEQNERRKFIGREIVFKNDRKTINTNNIQL